MEVLTVQTHREVDILRPPTRQVPGKNASPHELIRARIGEQYEEMLANDPGARLGEEPEAVHKFRVAIRRLRSVLRSARPMVDRVWADELRAELDWLAQALGRVRDLDVLIIHLEEEVAELPDDHEAGELLLTRLRSKRAAAQEELVETLASNRYATLLARVEQAAPEPPWVGDEVPVEELAREDFERFDRAASTLGSAPSSESLHRVRIRAKRARYAAEIAETRVGRPARRFVSRAKKFQDAAGEHQDAVVAEQTLRGLVRSEPQLTFVAGRLVERQRERSAEAQKDVRKTLKKLRKAGKRAWR